LRIFILFNARLPYFCVAKRHSTALCGAALGSLLPAGLARVRVAAVIISVSVPFGADAHVTQQKCK
jgi:hypothetical protein